MATSAGNAFFTKLQIPTRTTGVINKVIDTNSEIDNKADITYVDSTFLPIAGGTITGDITHGTTVFKSDKIEADTVIVGANANTAHITSDVSGDLIIDDGTLVDANRRDVTCNNVTIRNIANDGNIDVQQLLDIDIANVEDGYPIVLTSGGRLRNTNTLPNMTYVGTQLILRDESITIRDGFSTIALYSWGNQHTAITHQFRTEFPTDSGLVQVSFNVNSTRCVCSQDLQVNGAFTNPSDARAKYNIIEADYESAYNRIKVTPMHSFTYRHPRGDIPIEFGIVADELQVQFPHMINVQEQDVNNADGTFKDENGDVIPDLKTVNISGMIQVLAAALKHAQTEIDWLKARVTTLEGG